MINFYTANTVKESGKTNYGMNLTYLN